MSEPYRLTHWSPATPQIPIHLFTCARPGRSLGARQKTISDNYVLEWVAGLPKTTTEIAIISLLGRKADGLSEFSYYSFRGGYDQPEDRPDCPTFQEWLDSHCKPGRYSVCEYPTVDLLVPSKETKSRAVTTIVSLIESHKTVVVVDSGGIGRSGNILSAVASRMGIKLLPRELPATTYHMHSI